MKEKDVSYSKSPYVHLSWIDVELRLRSSRFFYGYLFRRLIFGSPSEAASMR